VTSGTPDAESPVDDLPGPDQVFRGLADPSRRHLLDALRARNGQSLNELCVGMDMARQSVSKHLGILESANLVTTVRRGRQKLHYLNPVPINDIAERWINRYDQGRLEALADLKRVLEEPTMTESTPQTTEFVYVTYIRTTPEELWRVLTDPVFTRRWWQGTAFDTDLEPGSTMTWHHHGLAISHPEQVVLESDPLRRLSYTWHTFTPEWADAVGLDQELRATIAAERRSKATFDLEPLGELVKLTVTHGDLEVDGAIIGLISNGWPRVISDLKSLVETGEVAPA
jgi:DNA-binding transcriptional ArsR family regulator